MVLYIRSRLYRLRSYNITSAGAQHAIIGMLHAMQRLKITMIYIEIKIYIIVSLNIHEYYFNALLIHHMHVHIYIHTCTN